ncbi:MAG: hypothetical protein IAF58_17420 [Leptolyngbya sp.]|nr:hypothetical protein [Candidatus Melainabacteria bacterium]
MDFTPNRMMRYIRSRARLSTDEDIEDILQNALLLVTMHFDPTHPDANLSLYCLGACNKAIAQNLERYHKVILKKRDPDAKNKPRVIPVGVETSEAVHDGESMKVTSFSAEKTYDETTTATNQWRTTSLNSMFDEDDGRNPDDLIGLEMSVLGGSVESNDPAVKALINDLIEQVMAELPSQLHRTCFLLKYVEGYKREDLISCLKMDPKSIDTVDKKIVRTLKAYKEKLDRDEARI